MKQYVSLVLLLVSGCVYGANEPNGDSLRRVLPLLTGTRRADALNQLSEHYLRVNLDSAGYFAQQAYSLATALHYSYGIDLADYNRGTVAVRTSHHREADQLLRQAIDKLLRVDPYHAGWAMCYLGDNLKNTANYQEAIHYLTASLPLLRKYPGGDPGKPLTFLGMVYRAIGDYETGLEKAKQSYAERLKMGDQVALGWSYFNLATLYGYVDDLPESVNNLHLAERAFKTSFTPGFVYASLARVFRQMNHPDSASFYLNKAIELAPSSGSTRSAVGNLALADGQYDKAIREFNAVLAKDRAANNVEYVMNDLQYLSTAYLEKKSIGLPFPTRRNSTN